MNLHCPFIQLEVVIRIFAVTHLESACVAKMDTINFIVTLKFYYVKGLACFVTEHVCLTNERLFIYFKRYFLLVLIVLYC